MENRFRQRLADGRFVITIEIVTPSRDRELGQALAPALMLASGVADDRRVAALGVTDRVRSDDDHDPVRVAVALARASGTTPVVHLSGKDRCPETFDQALGGLAAAGIDNVLCVTGDRLKVPPVDRRVRYLDSVEAIAIARRRSPGTLIGGGVSPFKYTEEETRTQYAKMARKQAAGAGYLITQVGWDMPKLGELMRYRQLRGFTAPVLANVMALPAGAARRLHKGGVPGVVVTDDLLALVEYEAQAADRGRTPRFTRLALQLVGAERLGYAGAQVSGLTIADDVRRVLDLADAWRHRAPTLALWWSAWDSCMRLPGGAPARLGREAGYFLFDGRTPRGRAARGAERRRYLALSAVHHVVFDPRSPVFHALRPIARRIAPGSAVARFLAAVERAIKAPIVGCELCGACRLPDTFYVCPETCPKGLANGPCGGSTDNVCEAGDRECVHALVYRLARAAGRVDRL
ncbi:MAG: methylenetetrahydrofolate reductase C-terminal domain-containing protein, partial [Candidatus Rokubacteria bacterium]|nr:methylenetetrahydrofolate reductase C-terminal domain-containing protein [Candidatus Rokubacteria bacterium]